MPDADALSSLLVPLAASYGLVLAAPGPNLFVVLRTSLTASPGHAACAALGVASGAALATALAAGCVAWLPGGRAMQWVGAGLLSLLLLRTALRLVGGSLPAPGAGAPASDSARSSYLLGLAAAAANPVTVSFFAGFFLGHPLARAEGGALVTCATVFVMAALWFTVVGVLVSRFTGRLPWRAAGRWAHYGLAAGLVGSAMLTLWQAASS